MRERCRQHGIAVPGSVAVTAERVDEPPLPFPVVVKPVDCGGSLMVTLARDTGEHLRACAPLVWRRVHRADGEPVSRTLSCADTDVPIAGIVGPAPTPVVERFLRDMVTSVRVTAASEAVTRVAG